MSGTPSTMVAKRNPTRRRWRSASATHTNAAASAVARPASIHEFGSPPINTSTSRRPPRTPIVKTVRARAARKSQPVRTPLCIYGSRERLLAGASGVWRAPPHLAPQSILANVVTRDTSAGESGSAASDRSVIAVVESLTGTLTRNPNPFPRVSTMMVRPSIVVSASTSVGLVPIAARLTRPALSNHTSALSAVVVSAPIIYSNRHPSNRTGSGNEPWLSRHRTLVPLRISNNESKFCPPAVVAKNDNPANARAHRTRRVENGGVTAAP